MVADENYDDLIHYYLGIFPAQMHTIDVCINNSKAISESPRIFMFATIAPYISIKQASSLSLTLG